jgi:hypothetical protein
MKKKVVINVAGHIGQIIASVSHDGEMVYQLITEALQEKRLVILDFSDIDLVTSSFLTASISQLYNKYDQVFLDKYLKFENLKPVGETTLKMVQEWAQGYFKNNKAV